MMAFIRRGLSQATRRSYLLAKARYRLSRSDPIETNPVIVYTVGKVGSSSVAATLSSAGYNRPVAHVHWLQLAHLERDERHYKYRARQYFGRQRVARLLPYYIWLGKSLNRAIARAPREKTWDVITMVREPVARNVSAFFQNLEPRFDVWPEEAFTGRPVEETADWLIDLFLAAYVEDRSFAEEDGNPLTWFDIELNPTFGVDVFASRFMIERGFQTYSSSNARILLMRLEDLDRVGRSALEGFLSTRLTSLSKANDAIAKAYANVYRAFKERIRLPAWYLEQLYSSRYCRHFYSEAELGEFKKFWDKPGM